ncbi:MAG: oxaloacetate decarboxylase [Dehalococcoidia bacterium]
MTAARLRSLLAQPGAITAPGAYDALTARIIEACGFPVVYMTGYGTSATLLGQPDVGLLSLTEMVDNARRIVQAVRVPVIADADTGYGNPLNVARTVRAYEAAGVAGLHLEDQVSPKKCGHMSGKQVIPAAEMVQKLRAAVEARRDPDLLIIARTDARAVNGLDDALDRGRRYLDAGADMLFIEAPESEAEVERIAQSFDGPLLYNWAESGRTPPLPLARIEALGFKLVIYPVTALFAATRAIMTAMTALRRDGDSGHFQDELIQFADFNTFIGLPAAQEMESRYATPGGA